VPRLQELSNLSKNCGPETQAPANKTPSSPHRETKANFSTAAVTLLRGPAAAERGSGCCTS